MRSACGTLTGWLAVSSITPSSPTFDANACVFKQSFITTLTFHAYEEVDLQQNGTPLISLWLGVIQTRLASSPVPCHFSAQPCCEPFYLFAGSSLLACPFMMHLHLCMCPRTISTFFPVLVAFTLNLHHMHESCQYLTCQHR